MTNQKMPDYYTIRVAVAGDAWSVEKVVVCYQEEIKRQATVRNRQPDGTVKEVIDKDMRQHITMKLIEALPTFPLEELEKQSRK